MTSDGLSDEVWEEVVALSADIANAVVANDDRLAGAITKKLLRHLNELERKYGALPSILAAKAECVNTSEEQITLLERAWSAASKLSDMENLVLISSSLAQLCVEELHDCDQGRKWLTLLETSLENYWDDDEYRELERLRVVHSKNRPPRRG